MKNLKNLIIDQINEVSEIRGSTLVSLEDSSVLLESGLDSLGFAILVIKLEELLGFDPFVVMETPVYPKTLGEFVKIYEEYKV